MPLNFKVPEEFRREFKTYTAQHNMKRNQVLFNAFVSPKEKDAKYAQSNVGVSVSRQPPASVRT